MNLDLRTISEMLYLPSTLEEEIDKVENDIGDLRHKA